MELYKSENCFNLKDEIFLLISYGWLGNDVT